MNLNKNKRNIHVSFLCNNIIFYYLEQIISLIEEIV